MNIYNSPRYAHSLVMGDVGPGWQVHRMGIHLSIHAICSNNISQCFTP